MVFAPPARPRSPQDGPKAGQDGPRSAQDGSKTIPRRSWRVFFRSWKSTSILNRFGIDFASILAPQMPPFWHPCRIQIDEEIDEKKHENIIKKAAEEI